MAMFRKRTYATTFGSRPRSGSRFKRRKFIRNRRANRRGGKRTVDYTQQNTTGHTVTYRGRKVSRKAYKRHIWNSTIFKDHYRSIQTLQFTDTAPANFGTTGRLISFPMYRHTTGSFWEAAGGAQDLDAGTTVPTFQGGIILRGGLFRLVIANQTGDDVRIKMWQLTTGNNPDLTVIPVTPDAAWDPSITPDFYTEVGRPFLSREVTIEGGGAYTFQTRFKTQKIDEVAYSEDARAPFLIVMLSNINSNNASQCSFTHSYNLSFSADVVTPAV